MDNIIFSSTKEVPEVRISFEENLIEFNGKLMITTNYDYYDNIMSVIESYIKLKKNEITTFIFNIEYLSSRGKKNLFSYLNKLSESVSHLIIGWYYENGDEDIFEMGLDFESLLNVEFKFIQKEIL
jgi:hypothetical protein